MSKSVIKRDVNLEVDYLLSIETLVRNKIVNIMHKANNKRMTGMERKAYLDRAKRYQKILVTLTSARTTDYFEEFTNEQKKLYFWLKKAGNDEVINVANLIEMGRKKYFSELLQAPDLQKAFDKCDEENNISSVIVFYLEKEEEM